MADGMKAAEGGLGWVIHRVMRRGEAWMGGKGRCWVEAVGGRGGRRGLLQPKREGNGRAQVGVVWRERMGWRAQERGAAGQSAGPGASRAWGRRRVIMRRGELRGAGEGRGSKPGLKPGRAAARATDQRLLGSSARGGGERHRHWGQVCGGLTDAGAGR